MDENSIQKTPLRRPVRQFSQQQPEKKERIPTWMAISMIVVALCIDILTLIPIVGSGVSVAAYVAFFIWFKMRGVVFSKNFKNLGSFAGSAIIEFFFSPLPAFTAAIVALIFFTRAEDKGGLLGKAASLAQGKIKS
jgi:hypothetical protein